MKDTRSPLDKVKDRLLEQEKDRLAQMNQSKTISEEGNTPALNTSLEKPVIENKKRGRTPKLKPEEKRNQTLAFTLSTTEHEKLKKALENLNQRNDFRRSEVGISEFISSLVFTHPKFQELLKDSEV
jgi:hypothetical protein